MKLLRVGTIILALPLEGFLGNTPLTTTYIWCDNHSISISDCEVCGVMADVQVSRRKLHTHKGWLI